MTTTTLADRVLEVALSQLGVAEATGHNDGLPSERYMGGRREPWCAHFVCWCYREAGAPLPGDVVPSSETANPLASVEHLEEVFRRHGWLVTQPMPGDLVFFVERGRSDRGPGRHVGLVSLAQVTALDVVSGNWGNEVAISHHRRAGLDALVSGYGRRPQPDGWEPA